MYSNVARRYFQRLYSYSPTLASDQDALQEVSEEVKGGMSLGAEKKRATKPRKDTEEHGRLLHALH